MAIITFQKQVSLTDWASHHHWQDSNNEVATEQLTAVVDTRVDVIPMPHNDPAIS